MGQYVLGVRVNDVDIEEALKQVSAWLSEKRSLAISPARLIFTPGPEFLVTASRDEEFKRVLNLADLNLPDGVGLQIFGGIKNRVPGVDFMLALCQQAAECGWRIGLLGGGEGVAEKTKQALLRKLPKLKIPFVKGGKVADQFLIDIDSFNHVFKPIDILFVALGHPKQEKVLVKLKDQGLFRVGMGVGGSFDFIAGIVPEPPPVLSQWGLKWLGRFWTRPFYMAPKIWRAVVEFPLLILMQKLKVG